MKILLTPHFPIARHCARAVALFAALLAACGEDATGPGDGNGNPDNGAIVVTPQTASIVVGDSLQLTAAVTDSTGQPMSGIVTWTSSNESRATVSSTGMVTALAAGSVTITASLEGLEGTSSITVTTATTPTMHEFLATYLGGSDEDMARDVAVDAQGNVYVVGSTFSPDLPITGGVFGRTFGGTSDAFIVKFSPAGNVLWSTYLGGPNYERAYAVEVDGQGNVIVGGRAGAGFPVTSGAFQTGFKGGQDGTGGGYGTQDGFVCKIRGDGTSIIFCSYFGTSDPWIVRDVAVDASGDIFLASAHTSGSFPSAWTSGSYQPTPVSGRDGVIAKVTSDGSAVLWVSYIGGAGTEGSTPSVAVDAGGNAYYLTSTDSPDMPTPSGFGTSLRGPTDLFIGRFSPDGTSLIYGTYLGGSGGEFLETHQITVDAAGNAYVSAKTSSGDFPTTGGVFQNTTGGNEDTFISRLSPSGALSASTYLGGSGDETTQGIDLGPDGTINVAGSTSSGNFPVTTGGTGGGGNDVFVASLSPDLRELVFATTVGGSQTDVGRAAAVGSSGNFYVVGHSNSTDWPRINSSTPFQGGQLDGILAAFGP